MGRPDFERARMYASERLTHELSPLLVYHSWMHTFNDVVPAVERLADMLGVGNEELMLLRTAAWYHDLGFIERREGHEAISARIAAEVLPHFGYSIVQIKAVTGMIMATRLPQTPRTLLEQIVADADLDSLGRTDFLRTSLALRAELAAFGTSMLLADWFRRQLQFLQSHRYFTAAARSLRDVQKQQNIAALRLFLAQQEGIH